MDYLTQYRRQLSAPVLLSVLLPLLVTIGIALLLRHFIDIDSVYIATISVGVGVITATVAALMLAKYIARPMQTLQDAVSFTANSSRGGTAPDAETSMLGSSLVQALTRQIYDLGSNGADSTGAPQPVTVQPSAQPSAPIVADIAQDSAAESAPETTNEMSAIVSEHILSDLSIPVIGLSPDQKIVIANKAAAAYFGRDVNQMTGQAFYDIATLSFSSDESFEEWYKKVKDSTVTAEHVWERVRHTISDDNWKQFDMAASFSSGSSTGVELMLALFDRTDAYNKDDQELSLVALAVHELRTPLTVMRGYIEVFEDELSPTLTPELTGFMHKMQASAQQLTAFVGNILNVARVEEDQLALKLRSEDWKTIISQAVEDLELRAQVHGMHIELNIPDNLPPVATDRISVHEVVNNLVDNAIKYSEGADKIVISSSVNDDGLIETTVQDFGIGIPAAVMGELFQKFHRSHKSRTQVGGTGLGLYLCKALITAHGGHIWVRSKEGEGSLFTFTLLPFDKLSAEQVAGEDGIIRGAHGWIKNHSLYRN